MESFQTDRAFGKTMFRRDENPYGLTWERWTVSWWRWLLSIERDISPAKDETGEKFRSNNVNDKVIFLVGTFDGESAERNYTIESRKALLFPVINFITSYAEDPSIKTDTDLKIRANEDIDKITHKMVEVDGVPISNVEKYRVQSEIFLLTLPEDNVLGIRSCKTKAISDGYWMFLKGLEPGKHRISASGACMSGATRENIIWNLNAV